MGQKVNPHGLRVGVIKDWDAKWYAEDDFADNLVEDYNIVYLGTVTDKFILLKVGSNKSVGTVYEEFEIGLNNLGRLYGVKTSYFGTAGIFSAILLLESKEPLYCHPHHVRKILVNSCYFGFHPDHSLLGLGFVEFEDTGHLDLHEFKDILLGHFTYHLRIEWSNAVIDMLTCRIDICSLLKFNVFIYTFLYENLFQRCKVQLLQKLRDSVIGTGFHI